jgi:quercetin dioxygenase-like cupin family protein
MGNVADSKTMQEVKPGALVLIPPNHPHYVMTGNNEVTITLNGVGPWEIQYVNRKDDPRGTPPPRPQAAKTTWDAPVTMKIIQANEVSFQDTRGLMPPGAKMAMLEGDPALAQTYTIRVKVPKGFKMPVHAHSNGERMTVLSGNVKVAMGDRWSEQALKPMKSPAIALFPRDQMHYAEVIEDAVIQLAGVGPYDIKYANPAEDPASTMRGKGGMQGSAGMQGGTPSTQGNSATQGTGDTGAPRP